ncbi:hypothetical protein [Lactobacillus johnsonii]|uniref:TetR/AcrR family transcriptional regulator n=1 Tax=Lactobacillus johnsonii TaxID=33959 RepID=UPI0028EDFE52|nr:hypothetical protein [Lactobacillus johnsonii]MDT9605169.1 hypothetical protein [Lactobacillus johnsonii]
MKNPYKDHELVILPQTDAQKALQNGLIELMKNKDINNISVKELCSNSNVARSTFYAYYNTLNDLLDEIEDRLVANISKLDDKIINEQRNDPKDFVYFDEILKYLIQNKSIFLTLLSKQYDHHLIIKWKKAIKAHLWQRYFFKVKTNRLDLLLEMVASEAIAGFIFFLEHPDKVNETSVYKIVAHTLTIFDL